MSTSSEKASDIVREKLLANGGTAVISLQKGDPCMIVLADNGSAVPLSSSCLSKHFLYNNKKRAFINYRQL